MFNFFWTEWRIVKTKRNPVLKKYPNDFKQEAVVLVAASQIRRKPEDEDETVNLHDGKESGIFDSNHIYYDSIQDAIVNEPLLIANELNNLTIEDVTGQIITLDHENANRLVRRGVMHKIDEVLKYTE